MFFLQTQLQKITLQEHIFGDFALAHIIFDLFNSPNDTFPFTYHPLTVCTMCAVDNFQRFRFVNSQSSDKFVGKPKIFIHPTSSRESLKQKINVYINIAHHLRGQWHSPRSPQTAETPFLDSYYFPVICPTCIRLSCLMMNYPPNHIW